MNSINGSVSCSVNTKTQQAKCSVTNSEIESVAKTVWRRKKCNIKSNWSKNIAHNISCFFKTDDELWTKCNVMSIKLAWKWIFNSTFKWILHWIDYLLQRSGCKKSANCWLNDARWEGTQYEILLRSETMATFEWHGQRETHIQQAKTN